MCRVSKLFLIAIGCSILMVTWARADSPEDFKTALDAVHQGDYTRALRLFRSLAAQKMPGARLLLGSMYFEGKGVTRNYNAALTWYRQEQTHPLAEYQIGVMYARGFGVHRDYDEAVKWLRSSAEQGYGMAQLSLGDMYAAGRGGAQDDAEAYKWFRLAAAGGGYFDNKTGQPVKADAAKRADELALRLTETQLLQAQERIHEWTERIHTQAGISDESPEAGAADINAYGAYLALKAEGETDRTATFALLQGVSDGLTAANAYLREHDRDLIYCEPDNTRLGMRSISQLYRSAYEDMLQVASPDMLKQVPADLVLIHGYRSNYPCGKSVPSHRDAKLRHRLDASAAAVPSRAAAPVETVGFAGRP
jgi:Sel1 repeat